MDPCLEIVLPGGGPCSLPPPKPALLATVGLPRSGKSTWVHQIRRKFGIPVVCPDSIRLAIHGQAFNARAEPFVWATAKIMVRSLFLSGHGIVIVDATNTAKKRRLEWFDESWTTYWKVFGTDVGTCIKRAGDNKELVGAIEGMSRGFEPLDETCLRLSTDDLVERVIATYL